MRIHFSSGPRNNAEWRSRYPEFDPAQTAIVVYRLSQEAECEMPKEPIPIEDLTEKVLARMREHIEGKDVSEISIYEIEGGRSDQNWGVSIVRGGSDGPCAASRAAIFAMSELGKRYDLLADQ